MKVLIFDIETLIECFYVGIYVPEENIEYEFAINKWENNIEEFINFIDSYSDYYFVGYNSLGFDSQVVEWVYRNYKDWYELDNLEICRRIWQKAQDIIDDRNYNVFVEYSEYNLSLKHIDLYKVWHFDNKNRMVSLKRLEFEMDMETIEELPIPHNKTNLIIEEINDIKHYCLKVDVPATYLFYRYTIGDVDHPLYKGNNQIQIRLDIENEFGIKCLNYSNAKIGDEIIKKYYCEEKGIAYQELPKKGFFRKKINLKYCIPKVVSFKTDQLKEFLEEVRNKTIGINEEFEKVFNFYGQEYKLGLGGLHNKIDGKVFKSDKEYVLKDIDVSGFYPASIINFRYFPFHLGEEFLVGYEKPYRKRIELKPLAKKDKRIKGIVAGLKEAGNCPFGKSGDVTSWLYDKQMLISTTLTGQFSILMLIEDCELAEFPCIMANTDGATFKVERNRVEEFNKIKEEWKAKTVNTLNYELEEVDYEKMVFMSVNHYLAIKENDNSDDRVKLKGSFMKDFELHKNKSARIVPLALEQYYVNNVPIEKTIKEHTNIYDFAIRQKATRHFHYEGISNGKTNVYKKLIRYYVSNNGEKLFKIKNPECDTNAANVSIIEKKDDNIGYNCTVCNYLPKTIKVQDCDINFDYYISKAQKIIDKIALEGKKGIKKQPENQLNLFG